MGMKKSRVVLVFTIGGLVTFLGWAMFFVNSQPLNFRDGDLTPPTPTVEKFSGNYEHANEILDEMSLEEKIGQLLFVRVPQENIINDINNYHFGGYLLFGRDVEDGTLESLKNKIASWQQVAKFGLFIGIDEEGGEFSRLSYAGLANFAAPKELYATGGYELLDQVENEKIALLESLGVNVNFAPVVDVCDDDTAFIASRSFSGDAEKVAEFATNIVGLYHGTNVSATLKHFPGYAKNVDTHMSSSYDERSEEQLKSDLKPFKAGIDAGADFVMTAHNVMTKIDADNPASLSPRLHEILSKELGFSGITITDDLSMSSISEYYHGTYSAAAQAVLAGNNMLIVTDYKTAFNEILQAVNSGIIKESQIDYALVPVLALKIEKGLLKQ